MSRNAVVGFMMMVMMLPVPAFAEWGWYEAKIDASGQLGENYVVYLVQPDDSSFPGNEGGQLVKAVYGSTETIVNRTIATILTAISKEKNVNVYMDSESNGGYAFYFLIKNE